MSGITSDRRLWIITIAAFIILVAFLDRNNLVSRSKLRGSIRDLERQKEYYLARIAEDSTLLEHLKDDAFLEQFAREHYLMRRDGETLYIVEE